MDETEAKADLKKARTFAVESIRTTFRSPMIAQLYAEISAIGDSGVPESEFTVALTLVLHMWLSSGDQDRRDIASDMLRNGFNREAYVALERLSAHLCVEMVPDQEGAKR